MFSSLLVQWAIEDYLQLNHINEDITTEKVGRSRLRQLLKGPNSLDVITEIRSQYKTARHGRKMEYTKFGHGKVVEIHGRDKILASRLRKVISDFDIGMPGSPRPNLRKNWQEIINDHQH